MSGLIKYITIASVTVGLISVITTSNADTQKPNSDLFKKDSEKKIVLAVDTPPDEEVVIPYPFTDNGFGEPVYNPNHPLVLNNPANITTDVSYDPITKQYVFEQKMGGMDYRPPTYMDEEEYQNYLFKENVKKHWRSRISADNINSPNKSLIPKLTVGGELFDRIFGGNTVDIRPQGSAELIFGVVTNRNQNPALPVKQRKISNFDFNMRVQLNLVGKIGEKLKLTANYNTEASFDFENQMKLEYTGLEDEILKKIEAGNVSLPLNSSLITGSQTLFGVKTQMQFGRLTATTVFSQQRGKKQEVTVQGGSQTTPFSVNADNYEANKHYFLSHFFRDNYNTWLANMPVISSPAIITKIEVYVTNRTSQVTDARNVVGLTDLGEDTTSVNTNLMLNPGTTWCPTTSYAIRDSAGKLPANGANSLYYLMTNSSNGVLKDRVFNNASINLSENIVKPNVCNSGNKFMESGRDYELITRGRKLQPSEYTYNKRLGYISLNQALNFDEVLAVSYQYTYNGVAYQVGEFSDQFPAGDSLLILKLLKSTQINTKVPVWDLMMKNVYSLGAYQINPADFKCEVFYNNIKTGVDIPYIPYGNLNGQPLVQVLNLDRISVNGDAIQDGFFDFVEGVTINSTNGRIYFPSIEPFGNNLQSKFSPPTDPNIFTYLFQELYDSTKVQAQQLPEKNRYKIKGSYKSASSNEISLNAMNIPQGSVVVTAGGVPLVENQDYTVDYTLGRVRIINESILNSGQPIKVSVENNSLFNIQQKTLIGTRLDFRVNRDLTIGGTFLRLTERPLTQKVNVGDEPISNIIWGVDYNYKTDAPFLTRLVDKIPLINTKEMSSIQTAGEFAHLIPGHSKAIGKEGNSYVDDFEGSISTIDLRNQGAWFLASVPQGQPTLFPEATEPGLVSGVNRARTAWYTIDQSVFYQETANLTPTSTITKNVRSNNFMRQIIETQIFPNKQPPNGQPVQLPVLDLAFYPEQRGPYNFDVEPTAFSKGINFGGSNAEMGIKLIDPKSRWGGIMRRLETNDFQSANIEFIQFWMMDPFNSDYNATFGVSPPTDGELYINIGNISEDILKDGKMAFENGLPIDDANPPNVPVQPTDWGQVPLILPISNAFDNNEDARPYQDVGYDGLRDVQEVAFYQTLYLDRINTFGAGSYAQVEAGADPSGDNYHFYRGDDYDALQSIPAGTSYPLGNTLYRYRKFNNPQGNSPTEKQYQAQNSGYPTAATTLPNIEDLNRDNTLNETESYYQYKIKITPQDLNPANVGNNYITNAYQSTFSDANGASRQVYWYQLKVPITSFEEKIGTIEGFNSIRFMRMFLKNFDAPVVCRMARLELVRSDWRRYLFDLTQPGEYIAVDDNSTSFEISAVNVQENGSRTPVNYVIPPGINQQQNVQTTNLVLLNEQALVLRTCNLKDGDSRAAYKNVEYDVRSFKKLKMFVHAEQNGSSPLNDGEMTMFVRLGSDFNNNYYEYEVPLKITQPGNYDNNSESDRYKVWPQANEVVIDFKALTQAKLRRYQAAPGSTGKWEEYGDYGHKITVFGNPNIATIKSIMVGVRNPKDPAGLSKCVEVWINELRLTDFEQQGGWAANTRVTAKLADFGQVALSGAYMTPFFGGIEKKISERSRETLKQYDASTTLQMGKFLPDDWKLNIPLYMNYSEIISSPQFDPNNPDVLMKDVTEENGFSKATIKEIKRRSEDYTLRRGMNLTNVSKQRGKNKKKSYPWDVENLSLTYAFTEQLKRNLSIDHNLQKTYRGALSYNYQFSPKNYKPFGKAKAKWINNKWFALLKETNFYLLPSRFGFTTDIIRNYNEVQNRNITSDANLKEQYNKTFNMTRNYDLKWDLTKNVKFDMNANNDGRILEPIGRIDTKEEKDVIKKNITKGGLNVNYRQAANLNVTVPINKIPIFDFANVNYKYGTTYGWARRTFAVDTVGNTIQNSNTHSYSAQFNMNQLYNKIPYFKKVNTGVKKDKDKDKKPPAGVKDTAKKDKDIALFEHIARLVMTLKQTSITYNVSNGTSLPGFTDSTQFLGMNTRRADMAPGLPFVFGNQKNVLATAMENEWIVKRQNLANPFSQTSTKSLNYRANLEPFKDMKIELTGTRTYGENNNSYVYWDGEKYQTNTNTRTGNFSISTITIGSAFKNDDKVTHVSPVFEKFRDTRADYARIFSEKNPNSTGMNASGGYDGYGLTQQDVIINSFLSAYTARGVSKTKTDLFQKIPLPNWSATYDGFGKLKPIKKIFKTFTLRHAYRSTYSIGGYSNNILFNDPDGDGFTSIRLSGGGTNFISQYQINTVTISEQFSPLIKVDMSFQDKGIMKGLMANFEVKRDRNVSLNANIPQVSETKGNEMIIGFGYRYPDLELKRFKVKGKAVKSDLNFKVDLSIRKNVTVLRRVIDGYNQLTGGSNVITLKTSIDYVISQNINLRIFYDRIINKPVISTSFPTSNTNTGVSIRLNLGG